ncbi:IS4 family transposase [Vibrio sp. PP-XX7]
MNVNQIITQFVSSVSHRIHQTRARALASCVQSAMSGQRLTVTDLGRGLHTQAFEKHAIKRADRLCSNSLLLAQLPLIYHHLCTLLVPQQSRPVIHVDWSDMNLKKTLFLIRASLSFEGRALTLYEEVHTLSTKEKAATHESFLQMLAQLLPHDVKPIIVTDAGFKRPWFKSVRARGWDFVGRIRGRVLCQPRWGKGTAVQNLVSTGNDSSQRPKNWFMGNKAPYQLNLVLYKARPKGRIAKTAAGKRQQSNYSRKNARRAQDPWLLADLTQYIQ